MYFLDQASTHVQKFNAQNNMKQNKICLRVQEVCNSDYTRRDYSLTGISVQWIWLVCVSKTCVFCKKQQRGGVTGKAWHCFYCNCISPCRELWKLHKVVFRPILCKWKMKVPLNKKANNKTQRDVMLQKNDLWWRGVKRSYCYHPKAD